jgi:hypothetical protein
MECNFLRNENEIFGGNAHLPIVIVL